MDPLIIFTLESDISKSGCFYLFFFFFFFLIGPVNEEWFLFDRHLNYFNSKFGQVKMQMLSVLFREFHWIL